MDNALSTHVGEVAQLLLLVRWALEAVSILRRLYKAAHDYVLHHVWLDARNIEAVVMKDVTTLGGIVVVWSPVIAIVMIS